MDGEIGRMLNRVVGTDFDEVAGGVGRAETGFPVDVFVYPPTKRKVLSAQPVSCHCPRTGALPGHEVRDLSQEVTLWILFLLQSSVACRRHGPPLAGEMRDSDHGVRAECRTSRIIGRWLSCLSCCRTPATPTSKMPVARGSTSVRRPAGSPLTSQALIDQLQQAEYEADQQAQATGSSERKQEAEQTEGAPKRNGMTDEERAEMERAVRSASTKSLLKSDVEADRHQAE